MTARENFVSRWARLKGRVESARKTEPLTKAPQPAMAIAPEERSDSPDHGDDFDPASLPSIESIAADTDIRAFLQSCVPAELTRIALRRAWASDPAIRDFVGIAENQWDFNDPDAIPGFGPLQAIDNLPSLLPQAPGNGVGPGETLPALPVSREQAPAPDRDPCHLDRSAGRTLDQPKVIDTDLGKRAVGDDGADAPVSGARAAEANEFLPDGRSHGSALPRFKNLS